MLKLSKKIDHGLILLRELCVGDCISSAREIAARYRLPQSMAANILKKLTASGILISTRGAQGGYELARHPTEINLAEIVESLEGPFSLVDCVESDSCCQFVAVCPTHDPMQEVHRRFYEFMTRLNLAEIVGIPQTNFPIRINEDENAYLSG